MTSASIWTLRQGDYPKGSMLIRRRVKNSVLTGKGGYVDLDGNVAVGTGWRWEIDFSDLRKLRFSFDSSDTMFGHLRLTFELFTTVNFKSIASYKHEGYKSSPSNKLLLLNKVVTNNSYTVTVDEELIRATSFEVVFEWPAPVMASAEMDATLYGFFHSHKAYPHMFPITSGFYSSSEQAVRAEEVSVLIKYVPGPLTTGLFSLTGLLTITVDFPVNDDRKVDFKGFENSNFRVTGVKALVDENQRVTLTANVNLLAANLPRRCYWLGQIAVMLRKGGVYKRIDWTDHLDLVLPSLPSRP
nr:33.6 kDa protein 2c [Tobacco rattle virus]